MAELGDRDRRRSTIYPSPFFDIAQTYMPPTVKELFRWCQYFFYKDPVIGAVVQKIAEYPITDFVYNASSKHVRDSWKTLLEDTLNLKPFLIEVGLDYFTYGNAFVSINLPFVRWIQCTSSACKAEYKLSDKDFAFKLTNYQFQFTCKKCSGHCTGRIIDRPIKDGTKTNFVRWDPKNIDINYNPITGRSKYRYKIPNRIGNAIRMGDRELLQDTPAVFLEALRLKRDVELSPSNLFHFKRPTLAEQDMGWGKPLIIHSMGRMFYLYVLRRAQEAIAMQRILPLEFIFPQANGVQDPYQHTNLGQWQGVVQEEIRKWRQDPNYISVVAVPLGFERLGGDGRALLLGPEIDVTNKEITGGMGVPIEFVFGGLSWSGSSVSLRTLENHFLLYRRLLLRFVNWTKNRLRLYLNRPDVDIGFTEFKMADDVQRKQIFIQLNAANKISDKLLLTELGIDYDEEQKAIEREAEQRNKIQALMMKAQAEAQGEASIIQAKYQTRVQEAMGQAAGMVPGQEGQPGAEGQAGAPAQPDPGQLAMDHQMGQEAAMQSAAEVKAQVPGQPGEQSGGASNVRELGAATVAKQWANRIAKMPPPDQQKALADLQRSMPSMFRLVSQLLASMGPGGTVAEAEDRAKPQPQFLPPRRKDGAI